MGRRSLVDERRAQIIEEAAKTIGRYGLEGATQERISEDCGLSRSHIRHYVGNRAELIDAVWDFAITPYVQAAERFRDGPDAATNVADLVDFLFGPDMEHGDDDEIINTLTNGAAKDANLRDRVYSAYQRIEGAFAQTLQAAAPHASLEACTENAYILLCLAIGSSSLSAHPFPSSRRLAARRQAEILIKSFTDDTSSPVPA